MVENIVAIELAYINTKHPDFYKDASSIGGMLKSPDMEADNRGQVRLILRDFLCQQFWCHVMKCPNEFQISILDLLQLLLV